MKQRLSAQVAADNASTGCYTNTDSLYRNQYSVSNVNVSQGPRSGNTGAHAGKRAAFQTAKAERAPLAEFIEAGYAGRERDDYADKTFPREGSISENNPPRQFGKRAK